MAEVIKTGDVSLLTGKVAVLGYGSQGHAHALSLRDSGVDVRVGLPATSRSRAKAEEQGLRVVTPAGKTGFVAIDAIAPIGFDQLCYVKDASGWKITGFASAE